MFVLISPTWLDVSYILFTYQRMRLGLDFEEFYGLLLSYSFGEGGDIQSLNKRKIHPDVRSSGLGSRVRVYKTPAQFM